jgi:hypothetical protein
MGTFALLAFCFTEGIMARYFLWIGSFLGLIAVTASLGVLMLLGTASGLNLVRQGIEWTADKRLNGHVTIERAEGGVRKHLILHNVSLKLSEDLGGYEVVGAREVWVSFSLWDTIFRQAPLYRVAIDGLRLTVIENADDHGRNSIDALLSNGQSLPVDDTKPTDSIASTAPVGRRNLPIALPDVQIARGRLSYFDPRNSTTLEARNIFVRASIKKPFRIKALIGTHRASFAVGGFKDDISSFYADIHIDQDSLTIRDLTLEAVASPPLQFHVTGAIPSIQQKTAALDIRATGDVGSIIRILGAADAPMDGSFHLSGSLRGLLADPAIDARFESSRINTDVGAFTLASIDLTYQKKVLVLDRFRGKHEAGWISGQGLLDLSKPKSPYRLQIDPSTLALEALPTLLMGDTRYLTGNMQMTLDLEGTGFDGPPHRGMFHASSPLIRVEGHAVKQFDAQARYRDGQVHLTARSAMAQLAAEGTLHASGTADLTASITVPEINAFLSTLGDSATHGGADLTARLQGPLHQPAIEVNGTIRNLSYGDIPLGHLDMHGTLDENQSARINVQLDSTRLVFTAEASLIGDQALTGTLNTQNLRLKDYMTDAPGLGLDAIVKLEGDLSGTIQNPIFKGNGLLQDLTIRDENLGMTSMSITVREEDLSFTVVTPDFSVVADGLVSLTEGYPYDLRINVNRASLSPFLAIMSQRPIEQRAGRFSGRMQAVGLAAFPDRSTISVALDSLLMTVDDRDLHFSSPSTIKLDRQLITIDHIELEGDFGHVLLNGIASLAPDGLVDIEAVLEGVQLDFLSPFLVSNGTLGGSIDGLFSLKGSPSDPLFNGLFSTSDVQYQIRDQVNQLGTISASVLYENRQLQIPALSINTPLGSSTGTLTYPFDLRWVMAGEDAIPTGTQYVASLVMDNLAVGPLREFTDIIPADLDGLIRGRVDLTGSTTRAEDLTGTVALDSLKLFGLQNELISTRPIRLTFNTGYIETDALEMVIRRIGQPADTRGRFSANGRLVYRTDEVRPLESDFSILGEDITMEAVLALANIDLPLSGTLNSHIHITGPPEEQAVDGRFTLNQMIYNEAVLDSITGRVVYEAQDIVIHELQTWTGEHTLVAYGSIPYDPEHAASNGSPLGKMALTVEGEDVDLAFLSGVIYDLEKIEGKADILMSVGGTPVAPQSMGDIVIRNGKVRIRDIDPPFEASELRIQVEGSQFTLLPVEIKAGKGKIHLYSRTLLENLSFSETETHATMSRAELELVGSSKLTVNGTLSWTGNRDQSLIANVNDPLVVTGTVMHPLNLGTFLFDNTIIRPPEEPDPILERIRLDVEIDIPDLVIKNDLADIEMEGGVAFSNTVQNPLVTGNATAKEGGRIEYLDTTFDLITGRLEFNRRTPLESFYALLEYPLEQLDPDITIQASATEVSDIYNAEYDVDLAMSGPLSQATAQLTAIPIETGASSNPATTLVGPEVISLLTFGLPGITTAGATDAVTGLGDRALFMVGGTGAEKLLHLDEVRIEGDLLSQSGDETRSPLQVTLSKRINRRAQVTFTRLFNSSEYNLRVGYQLTNFLFIETFTDQISARPQNGIDLKLKFRFR